MSVSSSRYPLIRISKTGEMRLKNKVGNAILKENAYEDRALNTRLDTLSKHQFRQDKYMTYRQLEFATKQVSASEERPRTLSNGQVGEQLPPIDTRRRSIVAPNLEASQRSNQGGEVVGNDKVKGRWEKAITLVRLAVQNRPSNERSAKPVAGQRRKISAPEWQSKDLDHPNQLPPIHAAEGMLREPVGSSKRKQLLRKQPSLPEMLRVSREKTQKCLEDPRFMKLEQCLSDTKSLRETARQHRRISRTRRPSPDRTRYTR
ncbi:hypothetical protein OS493_006345 [Desmophyllum pertusum]|uniref:Uncharacterized protein n=1 Tax=Desmophyllum pertusum TaxID=174260 RepID=A0A9X0DCU7_9CNID|nr:hypothetical protein OS493_006345 [Desmophyllum pertusum]